MRVDTFAMDRTEVAADEFAEFLNASGNADDVFFTADEHATVVALPPDDPSRETRFAARPGYERYPANNVSWYGAAMPIAAGGAGVSRPKPSGKKPRAGRTSVPTPGARTSPAEQLAQFEQVWQEKQFNVLVPVDAHPEGASPYGMLNMAGNVLEWVSDWYRQNLCDFCNPEGENNLELIRQLTPGNTETLEVGPAGAGMSESVALEDAEKKRQVPPRDNPGGPTTGSFKVLRGGSWQDIVEEDLSTTRRFWLDPAQRFPHTGFRCSKESSRER